MARLPLALLVMLMALLLPAALAVGAESEAPGATIAQDEDVSGDDLDDATDAGVDDNDTDGDGVITCADFSTQDEAQIYFDANSGDEEIVAEFDSDGNGVVCEETFTDPDGGVHTGAGGLAALPGPGSDDGSGTASGAVLVLVALLAAAGGITLLRRRPLGR